MFLSLIYIILLSVKPSTFTTETTADIKDETEPFSTSNNIQESDISEESDSSDPSDASFFTTTPNNNYTETVPLEPSMHTNTLETLIEEDLNEESTASDIEESISSHKSQHEKTSHETFPTDENFPTEETVSTILTTETQNALEEGENENETESTNQDNENQSSNLSSSESTNTLINQEPSEHVISSTTNKKEDLTEEESAESNETVLNTELSQSSSENANATHASSHTEKHQKTSHFEASSETTEEEIKSEEFTTSTNFEGKENENSSTERSDENIASESLTNQLNEHTTTPELETTPIAENNTTKERTSNNSTKLGYYSETSESTMKENNVEVSSETVSSPKNEDSEEVSKASLEHLITSFKSEAPEATTEEGTKNEINSESIDKLNATGEHSNEIHTTISYENRETSETSVGEHENKSENTSEETKHLTSNLEEETTESANANTSISHTEVEQTFQSTLKTSENTFENIAEESHHNKLTSEATESETNEFSHKTPTTNGNHTYSESTNEKTVATETQILESHHPTTEKEKNTETEKIEAEQSEEVSMPEASKASTESDEVTEPEKIEAEQTEEVSMPEASKASTESDEVTEPQKIEAEQSEEVSTPEVSKASTESDAVTEPTIEISKESETIASENQKSKSIHHEAYTTQKNIGSVNTEITSLKTSSGSDTILSMVSITREIEKQPLDFETPACDYCDQLSDSLKTKLDVANSESSNKAESERTTEHNVISTIEIEKNVIEMETTPCLYCTTQTSEITKENQQLAKHSNQKPATSSEVEPATKPFKEDIDQHKTNAIHSSTVAKHGCSPESGTTYETHSKKENEKQPEHTTHESQRTQKNSKVTEPGHSTEHKMENNTEKTEKEVSGNNTATHPYTTSSREQTNEEKTENENIITSTPLHHSTHTSLSVSETNYKAESTKKLLPTATETEEESTSRSDKHLTNTLTQEAFKSSKTTTESGKEVKNGFHNPIIIVVKLYKDQKLNKSVLENILSSSISEVTIEYADLATEINEEISHHRENAPNHEESAEFVKTSERTNNPKKNEIKNECTKDDFENKKHCFCNISDYLTTLERKVERNEHIKPNINYCKTFYKVKKLVLKRESTRTYRSLITLDHTKPIGNLEYEGIEGIFEHNFDLPYKGRNFYNLPSESINITCTNDSTSSTEFDKEITYTWTFHPLSAAPSQTLPDKSKDITLHGLSLSTAGNYTCTIMKKESIEGKVWHKLEVVTFPTYDIKLNIFYRINDSCSLQTGDDLKTYLPKVISPILCANKREICHLDIERPRCLTREDDNYYNVSIQVKTSADVVFLIGSSCDINCKLSFYENIVSMIYRNAEIIEHISVRSEINSLAHTTFTPHLEGHNKSAVTTKTPRIASICPAGFGLERSKQRVCVICPKNTFSRENQSFCRMCPGGQYQPHLGSESCVPCNSPVDDTMCLRMLYTDTSIFKIYVAAAFGIVTILIIVIVIWMSGAKDNPEDKNDYFGDSLARKATNNPGNRGANIKVPPQIPPPDF